VPSRARDGSPTSTTIAERVQSILDGKELTLYRVSQESSQLYGRSSPYFLPHNLYYDLRAGLFRPSIHQVAALSRISGYRVADWLRVFGFNLEDITRLQVLLPSKRTIVLDASLTDPNEWVPWFDDRDSGVSIPALAPLATLLKGARAERIGSLQYPRAGHFLYAKIGTEDALAYPELLPGSIVRVNPGTLDSTRQDDSLISDRIFLVEHSKGFCCCRIRVLANGVIVPFDNGLCHAQVELRAPQEVKIWGTVDVEFQPLLRVEQPVVPKDLARRWKPQPLPAHESFGQLLKRARRSRNLSVREAAQLSRVIAEILEDDRYATSPSSFSDYELHSSTPRDFHKIVTLCSVYGLQFESVVRCIGVNTAETGMESMPDRYLSRISPTVAAKNSDTRNIHARFLQKLLEEGQEIPFFLRHSLAHFCGSLHVSLDDFFWVGANDSPFHPSLEKALVVMVNRRRKAPIHFMSKPFWQQPIYIVLKRDGTYLAACCSVENGVLVVHPYVQDFRPDEEYRLHQDAEVIGQIVAIARQLS